MILESDLKELTRELKKTNNREKKWKLLPALRDIGRLRQQIRHSKLSLLSRHANYAADWIETQSERMKHPKDWVQAFTS